MKQLSISRSFPTLLEAVQYAVEQQLLDISYNPKVAFQSAKDSDSGYGGRDPGTGAAYLTDDGILFTYHCSDGVICLNRYTPFWGALTDSPFVPVMIDEHKITFIDGCIPKTKEGRRLIAKAGLVVS